MDPASTFNSAWQSLERANARLEAIEVDLARLKTARLWWREGGSSGLFESYPNLNSQIRNSGRLHTEVLADQAKYREYTNELSRPYVRKLSVLDLPNETLLEIFKLAEGFDPSQFDEPTGPDHHWNSYNDPRTGIIRNLLRSKPSICPSAESIQDFAQYYTTLPSPVRPERDIQVIKTCRLVCHKFCDLSSRLVFRRIHFSLEKRSLIRLEYISKHPLLSKGVRQIDVNLNRYSPLFYDLGKFAGNVADELTFRIGVMIDEMDQASNPRSPRLTDAQHNKLRVMQSTLDQTANDFLGVSAVNNGPCAKDYEKRKAELREKHREYVALMKAQNSLLEGRDIYSRFAAAISRMPAARQIRLTDHENITPDHWQTVLSSNDVWKGLYQMFLRTRCWGLRPRPAIPDADSLAHLNSVPALIDAFRIANMQLNSVKITLCSMRSPHHLRVPDQNRLEFSSAMHRLQEFRFECTDQSTREHDSPEDILPLVSACADTPSLQKLHLQFDSREVRNVRQITDLGDFVCPNLTKLKELVLSEVKVNCASLIAFIQRLLESLEFFKLRSVFLCDGTWEEVLDECRDMQGQRHRSFIIHIPGGAESDDLDPDLRAKVFGYGSKSGKMRVFSPAELYVVQRRAKEFNPLRIIRNGGVPSNDMDDLG